MTSPRVEIDLAKIEHNTRVVVDLLAPRGLRVTGVTKAALGSPVVGAAMLRGGAHGLGDSRVENLVRLGEPFGHTLIRSPMPSQVERVVRAAGTSLNSDPGVVRSLGDAAVRLGVRHAVVLMVELGDLREGLAVPDVLDAAKVVLAHPGLLLAGLGTNLACQNGIVPDDRNMGELSRLVEQVERAYDVRLAVVSGGNSANLAWAVTTRDVGRVDDLRVGEAILLGTEPLRRTAVPGLSTDAVRLVAEVIEVGEKPAQPWGDRAQTAFGEPVPNNRTGTVRQAIVALGRQDADPDSLQPPEGVAVLGMSSDHLVLDVGDHPVSVGDELTFGVGYAGLLRAMTSPFVTKVLV